MPAGDGVRFVSCLTPRLLSEQRRDGAPQRRVGQSSFDVGIRLCRSTARRRCAGARRSILVVRCLRQSETALHAFLVRLVARADGVTRPVGTSVEAGAAPVPLALLARRLVGAFTFPWF